MARRARVAAATRDFIWKLALLGGLVTSTVQLQGGLHPFGSMALTRTPVAAAATSRTRQELVGIKNGERKLDAAVGIDRSIDALPDARAEARADAQTEAPAPTVDDVGTTLASPGLSVGIVIGWAVVAFALAVTYLARRLILVGRLTTRQAVTEGQMPAMLDTLRLAFGMRGRVHLTSASTISSPVALGLNEICVPDAALTDLDAEQQRGLLAHELAHLARRDPLWLDAASLIERVFFFQPLNRLARRELQHNAEYICDDWAASRTGSGEPLARCLARVAHWIEASPLGVPMAGMAEQRSMLVTRIARLLEEQTMLPALSRATTATLSLLVLGAVIAAAPSVHRTLPAEASQDTTMTPRASSSAGAISRVNASHDTAPEQDPAIVAALIERLGDSNAGVRRAAASSLGNLKSRKAVPPLIATLADKNREVRAAAADALGNIEDERAIAPLARLLKDPSADVRREVLHALAQLKDASVATAVMPLLGDDNADVRGSALSTLRELRAPIPEAAVMKALDDPSHDVRLRAVEVVKEQPAAAALVIVLRKMMLEDASSDVRQSAVEALSEARSPAARDALRVALSSPDAKVRRAAAEALGSRP